MTSRVYTRETLYNLQRHNIKIENICVTCDIINSKIEDIEAKILDVAKDGDNSLFITDKFLSRSLSLTDEQKANLYKKYMVRLKKIFPDSGIHIKADYENNRRGIYIIWDIEY